MQTDRDVEQQERDAIALIERIELDVLERLTAWANVAKEAGVPPNRAGGLVIEATADLLGRLMASHIVMNPNGRAGCAAVIDALTLYVASTTTARPQ